MRCRSCKAKAAIELSDHNAAYCRGCFLRHCHRQVERTIEEFDMIHTGDRVLVAVSGGKDSLALWHILTELGYSASGVYLNLGIGSYSDSSQEAAEKFAEERGLQLEVVDLRYRYGFGIPEGSRVTPRPTCSLCGISKRHILNQVAIEGGFDVLATGHNLDDEAASLLSNILRWELDFLRRQYPVLPAGNGFAKKVKPLIRLSERETAAYCVLSGIHYIVEECPLVSGNTQLRYKDALALLERNSPGTKRSFLFGYLSKGRRLFAEGLGPEDGEAALSDKGGLLNCSRCGYPTSGGAGEGEVVCAFCKESERIRLRISPSTKVANVEA